MKTLKSISDYINLAVSKDQGRYNLTGAYREGEWLVSSDGHRLHYVSGLPVVEKGMFLDGRDAQFPDWHQVVPKTPGVKCSLVASVEALRRLEALCKLIDDKQKGVKFRIEKGAVIIEASGAGWQCSGSFGLEVEGVQDVAVRGLNLSYLIDALSPEVRRKVVAEIEFRDANQVIEIWRVIDNAQATALVMPMRLDKI